jgi:tRNA (guanine37-N1)-methyltransferase
MKIDIVTIFPQMFEKVFELGVIGKAKQSGLFDFQVHNLRKYTTDKHQMVDDVPFGGGGGLIFKIEPLVKALKDIKQKGVALQAAAGISVLLTPRGRLLNHKICREFSKFGQLILFCGRYEGVDERFGEYVDDEISIGDYVLSGGEIAAMALVDSVCRFLPGVIGQEEAPDHDSFSMRGEGLLEYPAYTRPVEYEGKRVPEILRSGNHAEIDKWRMDRALNITLQRRPDLLKSALHDRQKTREKKESPGAV